MDEHLEPPPAHAVRAPLQKRDELRPRPADAYAHILDRELPDIHHRLFYFFDSRCFYVERRQIMHIRAALPVFRIAPLTFFCGKSLYLIIWKSARIINLHVTTSF